MKNRAFALILVSVLAAFVLIHQANGQSTGFIITNADAVVYIDPAGSPTLETLITSVTPRFVVQYADVMKFVSVIPIPDALRNLFEQIQDRFVFQYADANRSYPLNYPVNIVGDNDPPVILNLTVNGSGLVSWNTDEYSDGELVWGDQSGIYTSAISNTLYSMSHHLQMSGLVPAQVYYFRVASTDRSGNNVQSGEYTFVIDAPVTGLSASNDSPNELGSATTFTATISTGSNVLYTWDFGDGQSGIGQAVTHTYQAVGAYQASVTASNSVSNQVKYTTVNIVDVPITGLIATNNGPTELGKSTTLNASIAAGSNVTYTWDFGDGQSGNGSVVTHKYSSVGLYTAKVTATNGVSNLVQSTTVHIVDVPISGLLVSSNSPTELGKATTLTASVASGSNVVYAWDFGDGQTGNGSTAVHQYAAVGTYSVTLTAENSASNDVKNISVTIIDVLISGLSSKNNGPTKLGSTTTLSASVMAGSNVIYTWNFGDGETSQGSRVFHMYARPGMYTATVTASNSRNTISSQTKVTIFVNQYLPLIVH